MEQIVKMKFIDIQGFSFYILLYPCCTYLKNIFSILYNVKLVSTKIHKQNYKNFLLEFKILRNFIDNTRYWILHARDILDVNLYGKNNPQIFFGCESSPISRNVRSQLVS